MTDPARQIISEASLNEGTPAEIAETFAPVVWLHKDDQYRPSSVAWYLKRASLEYKNNKKKILAEGSVTGESLINQEVLLSQEEGFDYSDFTKPLSNRNQKFNLKITNVDSIMNGDLTTATCYVHIRPTLDIQYLFFYPTMGQLRVQVPMKETGNTLRSDFGWPTPQLKVILKKYTFLVMKRQSG